MNHPRLKKLQSSLKNPLLVKKKENLFYLTGQSFDHRAEEYLLITKKDAVGFGSGLEKLDWIKKTDSLKNIGKYLPAKCQLDIEWGFTYGEGKYLQFKLKDKRVTIKPLRTALDMQRMVKDEDEISNIRKSMRIVESVFGEVKSQLRKKGWTEAGLAKYIEHRGHELGAEDLSFPAIVASGANAAVPHHVPGNKKLVPGESVIIDFGFKYKGYCSDFTRTVFLKSAPKKLADAYVQVEQAYNKAIAEFASFPKHTQKRGISAGAIYQKSVDVLKEKKLDKYFIHSLGHGTGLEIHELPNLSPKSKDALSDGMVFSIEPGVYFPKLGGIRIEDLVYMAGGKCEKFIAVSTRLEDNCIK